MQSGICINITKFVAMATKIKKKILHSLVFRHEILISLTEFLFKCLLSCCYFIICDRVVLLWKLVSMETDHNGTIKCVFFV